MEVLHIIESESISKNILWGKEKAYREGKVNFQYKHLLGYKKGADGKPEIVPDEAETVKLIYKLFLDGYSMKGIKMFLKAKSFLPQWVIKSGTNLLSAKENAEVPVTNKNCDMICANSLKTAGAGFKTDTNVITLITEGRCCGAAYYDQEQAAHRILDELAKMI